MSTTDRTIFVAGATGQQGGATTRHLLRRGWRVRGLTRDASTNKAQALAALGAEVVEGNLNDRASFEAALAGVYGVFSVQNFWLPGVGAEGEVRQGQNLHAAAKAAGVRHVVYTSVGGAERRTSIPHFDSKWTIEQHLAALGLPATILRPVFFMDNLKWSRPYILNGTYSSIGLRPERTLQLIAVDDIGAIATNAFENPQGYVGRAYELAGDELTETQMAATLGRVIGRPVLLAPARNAGQADEENARMVAWFNDQGYQADIPVLRKLYPGLQTFEQYLRANGWANAEPVPVPTGVQQWGS